jgi:hypothetical protein
MLLQLDSLPNLIAKHGFNFEFLLVENRLVLHLPGLHIYQVLSARANSIHKFWLQKVVKSIQLEDLLQQHNINLACKAHQPNSLVFDLGH